MKRRAICFLLPILLLMGLAGCGGIQRMRTISTRECFTDELISIRYRTKGFPTQDGIFFEPDGGRDALLQAIAPQLSEYGYEAIPLDKCVLLRKQTETAVSYLMFLESASQTYFFNMRASLNGFNNSFLFPYHLMARESWQDGTEAVVSDFREGALYEAAATRDEFYDFYQSTNRYQLERTEDGFRINGYLEETAGDAESLPKFEHPVAFRFMTVEGYSYVSLSVD